MCLKKVYSSIFLDFWTEKNEYYEHVPQKGLFLNLHLILEQKKIC